MKEIEQYGLLAADAWEPLPWLPDPRPPFEIWLKPEEIAPFFLVEHHPFALSLLLRLGDNFKADAFNKMGRTGSGRDWEALARGIIKEWEEANSGADMFRFDSDEAVFCVFSQYIDDLMLFARTLRAACDDEKLMRDYLDLGSKGTEQA